MGLKGWLRMVKDWLTEEERPEQERVRVSRILGRLLEAAEQEAILLVEGRVLPDEFIVRISSADHAALGAGLRGLIETELARRLAARAKRRGTRLSGPPKVAIHVGRGLEAGRFEVEARLSGAIIAEPSAVGASSRTAPPKRAGSRPGKQAAQPPPLPQSMPPAPATGSPAADAPTRFSPEIVAALTVSRGGEAGTVYELFAGTHVVGRGSGADVRIGEDARVSREHFIVEIDDDGEAHLTDKSTNGTRVDGKRASGRVRLAAGSRITAGPFELIFRFKP